MWLAIAVSNLSPRCLRAAISASLPLTFCFGGVFGLIVASLLMSVIGPNG
ncbi:hypothetical protein [Paraburkholderia caffeinilytica]|uniref:Uncharacterized protein n=1 Tax=Paraburkholderia caffeinilytica TaxID=1761016 RepID=A0ABQ1NJ65_9BURK|nr:hypothetical protein [Paraburkholderia caffeinilytica]GGC67699.1 hypothetical protein GCM10011400_64500 [Paraburkholderia caffeinilytica]